MKLKIEKDMAVRYQHPAMEVTALEVRNILCTSGDPQSNFIEAMSFGEQFDGWN